jgi:putative SOS response-associated peptidase YedK
MWLDATVARNFSITTVNANPTMAELHDRMLPILDPRDWPSWLGEVESDADALLRPSADDVLRA